VAEAEVEAEAEAEVEVEAEVEETIHLVILPGLSMLHYLSPEFVPSLWSQ